MFCLQSGRHQLEQLTITLAGTACVTPSCSYAHAFVLQKRTYVIDQEDLRLVGVARAGTTATAACTSHTPGNGTKGSLHPGSD